MSTPGPQNIANGRHTQLEVSGQRALTVSQQQSVTVWSLGERAEVVSQHHLKGDILDLSLSPRDEQVAVTFRKGAPKLYDWSFQQERVIEVGAEVGVDRIAYSPCGRFLALATRHKSVLLYAIETAEFITELEGGARTLSIEFSPQANWFCWALSSQEGASLGIARLENDDLKPARGVELAAIGSTPEEFVDKIPAVAFNSSGTHLAAFQTSGIYHDRKPAGWRGDVVLMELESRRIMGGLNLQPLWQLSVDARVTRDSTADSGLEIAGPAQLTFCDGDQRLALGLSDRLIILDAMSGEPVSQTRTPALGVAANEDALWVAGNGLQSVPLA